MQKNNIENMSQREYTRALMRKPFWSFFSFRSYKYLGGLAAIILMIWGMAMASYGATEEFKQKATIFAVLALGLGLYLPKAASVAVSKLHETKLGRLISGGMIILAIICAGWAYFQQTQARKAMHEKYGQYNSTSTTTSSSENPVESEEIVPNIPETPTSTEETEPEREAYELRCGMIGWPDAPVAQCKYDAGHGEVTLSKPCEPRGNSWFCTYPSPSPTAAAD